MTSLSRFENVLKTRRIYLEELTATTTKCVLFPVQSPVAKSYRAPFDRHPRCPRGAAPDVVAKPQPSLATAREASGGATLQLSSEPRHETTGDAGR